MAQSLSKIYVHIIFHIKNSSVEIDKKDSSELYSYIGTIIRDNESIPVVVNGVGNHIHILCVMSKNIALSKLVEEIKRKSSRWIKTKGLLYENFAWQGGYAVFSVSSSIHDKTKRYIERQEQHHNKMNFNEEYLLFLKEYKIEYDERYLWND
ncbi:MAG: transposase [Prevotellaceae bacterium]|jgi:REP element-mobilizing transposase RayT|nr:transposase [Prevotellaceae bacterium]